MFAQVRFTIYRLAIGRGVEHGKVFRETHSAHGVTATHAYSCAITGMVYTPMMYGSTQMSDEERRARSARSLLQTEGNGWDVGAAIRFLAGDEARWITGVVLPVDAGTTAATGIGMKGLNDSTTKKS